MAKQGMKRMERTHIKPRNDAPPVPQLQGKAKNGKAKANPIMEGTGMTGQKVYHSKPVSGRLIASNQAGMNTDLAEDNLENDLPAADLQDI